MKHFIVYNKVSDKQGEILRTGICQDECLFLQAQDGEFVMEGMANDVTQKIVGGKVVYKTPEEIEADNPPPTVIPIEKQPVQITKEQWQDILNRLDRLEKTP